MKRIAPILLALVVGWLVGQHYPFHDRLIESNISEHAADWDAQAAKHGYPKGYCGHLIKDMAWSYSPVAPNQFISVCTPKSVAP